MEQYEINTHIRRPWHHDDKEEETSAQLMLLKILPLRVKNLLVAAMSEFAGTFLFLLFAFGGANAVNTNLPGEAPADPAKLLFISLCFGMSLAVNAWVFFRISGGLFNPAVTLGMMVVGAVEYVRGGMAIFSQIISGIAAAAVVNWLTPGPLNVSTSLGGGTSVAQGLFIEMFLTAQLVFTIFMLAAEKHRATFIAPVGIGLSLFIAELWGVYYTGGGVNPARAFGPSVVTGSFHSYHWIYWLGPVLGSLLASGFYVFIKALEYETVNPEQDDSSERRAEPKSAAQEAENRRPSSGVVSAPSGRASTSYYYGSGPSLEAGPVTSRCSCGRVPTT
ncbi:aquaporin-like protein [Hypoxylon sp. NC1633]|nr:aquaporin-like protein [Hypoxylon sp. NC1633]